MPGGGNSLEKVLPPGSFINNIISAAKTALLSGSQAREYQKNIETTFKTQRIMNLRNKILITLFALGTIFWGCDSLIFDDLSDCPQGVYVKFYSMTPCASDSTFIGSVASLTLFAFDENEKLVTSVTQNNVTLSRDYTVLIPVSDGNFTFLAWAGIDDKFILSSFTNGTTTKKDVMLTLKSTSGVAANLKGTKVWQGESPAVHLPNPAETASFYEYTAVNLQEVTNRLELIVEFDKATMKDYDLQKIQAEVSSGNGILKIDGSMPPKQTSLAYPSSDATFNDNVATWHYNLLDLKTGYDNKLNIFYGDLIAMILLAAQNGQANLDCDNDFTVKVVVKDYCVECWTHFSCSIYVNDWLVHSYSTDLGF